MSRKIKTQPVKSPVTSRNKFTRVGDLQIPGSVKPGQVIVGFSELLNQWLVYRISSTLQVIPTLRTFSSQEEAQTYGNQYTYMGGNHWTFSPAIPVQSQFPEEFDDYLPEDGGSLA